MLEATVTANCIQPLEAEHKAKAADFRIRVNVLLYKAFSPRVAFLSYSSRTDGLPKATADIYICERQTTRMRKRNQRHE